MKRFTLWTLLCVLLHGETMFAQVKVVEQHNDKARTGWNQNETVLNTSNVHAGTFGKVFSSNVDDKIYAQPLYVNSVSTAQGVKNVVYVATVNNTIYAIDADNGNQIWSRNFTSGGFRPPNSQDIHANLCGTYNDFFAGKVGSVPITANFGIVGTPAIDTLTNTMYFVTRDVNPALVDNTNQSETSYPSSGFFMYMRAIDIATGVDKKPAVVITASTPGTGQGTTGGNVFLDPRRNNQRGGLTISNGIAYITFAAHCDWNYYHGWVIGYDITNSTFSNSPNIVYCTTPNDGQGGIWMSAGAAAVDASGNLYVTSGNSAGADPSQLTERGESVIRLTPNTLDHTATSLSISSYFTPKDFVTLNQGDLDLPIQVMLPPGTNLAISGCKDGNLYVMNRNSLGGFSSSADNILQKIHVSDDAQMHASFAYFGGSTTKYFYQFSEKTALKAYPITGSGLGTPISGTTGPTGQAGAYMSVSSNGTDPATGVLWVAHAVSTCNANQDICPGLLRAFDASDITQELWNSAINPGDALDTFAKTSCPTISNGHVYVASNGKIPKLLVYGLANSNPCPGKLNIALQPNNPLATYHAVKAFVNDDANAPKAFDDETTTAWTSTVDDFPGGSPTFLAVDLGKNYDICSVVILWGNSVTSHFVIEGSNLVNPGDAVQTDWTQLKDVQNNSVPSYTLLLNGASWRHIRVRPQARSDGGVLPNSIEELQVYGEPTNPCAKVTGVSFDAPTAKLSWTSVPGAQSYSVKFQVSSVPDYRVATTNTNSITLPALTCGVDYSYIVNTVCSATSTSNNVTGTFSSATCTNPCTTITRFGHADIGEIGIAGSYCFAVNPGTPPDTVITIKGSGTGLTSTSDQFQFLFTNLGGDEEITARIVSIDASSPAGSMAGLMMRETMGFTSKYAFVGFTKSNGAIFLTRSATGGAVTQTPLSGSGITPTYFVKLRKAGTVYSAFISPTGLDNTWTPVGSPIDLGFGNSPVNVGLAVTSTSNAILTTAVIDKFHEGSSTPLPITLINFSAKAVNEEYVDLSWSTSMETNNDRFEIERSLDGNSFERILTVQAVGNSNIVRNYSAKDENPVQGMIYYRLKQVDLDGKSSYSYIVSVRFGKQLLPTIFPNPADSYFNVVAGEEPIKIISIYSATGQLLRSIGNDAGNSTIKVVSANLTSGVYIIQIKTTTKTYKQKLLKR